MTDPALAASGFRLLDVLALTFFVTGAFTGFLLTALMPVRSDSWWLWPAVRVAWQLGGGLWCGAALAGLVNVSQFRGALAVGVVGLVLCINPLLDLVRGPLRVEGHLVEAGAERGLYMRATGAQSPTIHGVLRVKDSAGTVHSVKPVGLQANRLEKMLESCRSPGGRVRVQALRHCDVVIKLDCNGR